MINAKKLLVVMAFALFGCATEEQKMSTYLHSPSGTALMKRAEVAANQAISEYASTNKTINRAKVIAALNGVSDQLRKAETPKAVVSPTAAKTITNEAVGVGADLPLVSCKIAPSLSTAICNAVQHDRVYANLAFEAAARGIDQAAVYQISFAAQAIPAFPWPYPQPSAKMEIDRSLLSGTKKATFSDVDRILSSAFIEAGYGDKSYYSIPEGFVMVSRLEQIEENGMPNLQARWSMAVNPFENFSLAAYLKALFFAQPGRYRVICFALCPHEDGRNGQLVTSAEATGWISHGASFLPKSIGSLEYTEDCHCIALIYEFDRNTPNDKAVLGLPPNSLPARSHLSGSGILAALSKNKPKSQ